MTSHDLTLKFVTAIVVLLVLASTGVVATVSPGTNVLGAAGEEQTTDPRELDPGEPVDGDLFDDQPDNYHLDVDRGQEVTITVTVRNLSPGGQLLAGIEGDPLPDSTDERELIGTTENETVDTSFVTDQSGRIDIGLFLERSNVAPDVDSAEYTLEASIGNLPNEPNDDLDNATSVSTDTVVSDSIRPAEVDYFAFTAEAGDRVKVTFDRESENGVTAVVLYDSDRQVVNLRMVGTPYPEEAGFVADESGTYYVEVADVEDGAGNYSLDVSTAPVQDSEDGLSQDELARAKYGLAFEDLSDETKGQVREIVERQPLVDGLSADEVQTREEIARDRFGKHVDQLTDQRQHEIEKAYLAQFADE